MKQKKPPVFVNKIETPIVNNCSLYYSLNKKGEQVDTNYKISLRQKVNEMFDLATTVCKVKALLTYKDGSVKTKEIIGIAANRLITIEKEQIPLSDLMDISY